MLLRICALAVAAFVLLPVATTIVAATGADPADARALLFRPLTGELLRNTLGIAAGTVLVCAVAGTLTAWLVERTRLPGRRIWRGLAVAPLAIPPFVSSYGWVSISPRLQDGAGALLVVSAAYMPLVFLPVAAALRGLDPALEEAGRALGLGPVTCFARVVLPQLRPALGGGLLLVALNTFGEFGAFTLLRFRTFTTELYAQYRTGLAGPDSAVLALVLLALCLAALAIEFASRRGARYARVGRGTGAPARLAPLGAFTAPALAWHAVLAATTVGVPVGTLLLWLTRHGSLATSPSAATGARVWAAASASLRLGAEGAALTVVLACPLAALAARGGGRLPVLLERLCFATQGVPAIVVALALVTLTLGVVPSLYGSPAAVLAAYAVLFLPLALVCLRAALVQVPPILAEAARSLGLGAAEAGARVTLPLAGAGIAAAAALVFVAVASELTATLLLAPVGTRTLATEIWADTSTLAFAAAAPYAALLLFLSFLSTVLLGRFLGRGAGAA